MKKSLLIVLLLTICRTEWTKCTMDTRLVRCSSQGPGVCGTDQFYNEHSQYANGCMACVDNAYGYFDHPCTNQIEGIQMIDPIPKGLNQEPASGTQTSSSQNIVQCTEPRPQMCTMEYTQTCGILQVCSSDSCEASYGNGCSACADSKVKAYYYGECNGSGGSSSVSEPAPSPRMPPPIDPRPRPTIVRCTEPRRRLCPRDVRNTCGLYGSKVQCIRAPCGGQYTNPCNACADTNVESYYLGDC